MLFYNWLRPAPFPKELEDNRLIESSYRYWRLRTFFGMYIGYALYYFTRKSFVFAIPSMLDQGFTLTELGLLSSILSIVYGFSKFICGIAGDRSNPRYFMAFGLIITGICNLCFGLSTLWPLLAIFWGLNAWFQGCGWPSCAKLLTHWYAQSERGTWWSLWNTSHNLGGAVIPILAAVCAAYYGWRFAMFVPGVLSILGGFFLIYCLRDIPQSLGLPPIEKYKNEKISLSEETKEPATLPVKKILFDYVLSNEYLWLLSFAYFFVYIIRIGFNDWSMVYLIQQKNYSDLKAASCILWFEVGGFMGSLAAGWASDKLFNGKRNPVNVLFIGGTIASLILLSCNRAEWFFLDALAIFLTGFFIFGPQMLIGMAAAEITHKKAAATSSGFAGCFAYLGGAVAGGPLGAFTNQWGWDLFFVILLGCALASLALLLPIWSIKMKVSPCESIDNQRETDEK